MEAREREVEIDLGQVVTNFDTREAIYGAKFDNDIQWFVLLYWSTRKRAEIVGEKCSNTEWNCINETQKMCHSVSKNEDTFLEPELVAFFLNVDCFLDIEWIGKYDEFFTVIDPKFLICLFDAKCEQEWITRILA